MVATVTYYSDKHCLSVDSNVMSTTLEIIYKDSNIHFIDMEWVINRIFLVIDLVVILGEHFQSSPGLITELYRRIFFFLK